ncbi:MAG TPA: sulfate adenylyltransferase subunit CysN [Candidatus Acidoferrum sp.]|nr:sulfate adenylyltransferase subunit CysN [Candidatus Acidoferrum sp.]
MISAPDIELAEGLDSFLEQNLNKGLLRFTTAGSVDDGKSTLIGRLLHDSKAVYEDQLASVKNSRINRSGRPIDFSLLTDGLRAEREQGITIDVAYRYFSTSRRKFIIADTPGHEQYTRNMATGASTADLAVILVDGAKGLMTQTRRHAYIASLLGIPSVLAAINKMDLVGYSEDIFLQLQRDFLALAKRLGIPSVQCIPVSALEGDNVVTRSDRMLWYSGPCLLEHLETVVIRQATEMEALRFPIQSVIRPDARFRGFAGRIGSGSIRPGDSVLALPSRQQTRVQSIVSFEGELSEAIAWQSVLLKLEDEIDLSRGDMLVSPEAPPEVSNRFVATVVWLHAEPLELNRVYLVKHAGRQVKARARRIRFRVDVNTLSEHSANQLEMNDIASVEFETGSPLLLDPYNRNRTTGSFILIDPTSNTTVGAAMIFESLSQGKFAQNQQIANEGKGFGAVTFQERHERHGHRPAIFGVRDEAVAEMLERELFNRGFETQLVRADEASREALPALLKALWSAGLAIVYVSKILQQEEQASLAAVAGDFLFDVSLLGPSGSSIREVIGRAIEIAESLRITSYERDEK